MALAKIVNLASATDKTVIHNVRAGVVQPFVPPDWLDLRVGFLLSITKSDDDDDTTGLTETIGVPPLVDGPQDRYWIGVKDNSTVLPATPASVFIGFCNAFDSGARKGTSLLASSDNGIGTTNANFWRPTNGEPGPSGQNASAAIFDGGIKLAGSTDGVQQHFAQVAAGAGGYATLLMLRLQRSDVSIHERTVTVTMKQGTHNGDVLFTNTPTESLLQTNLESFPGTVAQLGPVTMSAVPDSLFIYWPFHNSRLRIHAMGILKVR